MPSQLVPVHIRYLGQVAYLPVYQAMQDFTAKREAHTLDELWVLEHFPCYTVGIAAKSEHLLNTATIPVYSTDRGGQVTFHGLGQLVVYVLMDIQRRQWGPRQLVYALEQAVIDFLKNRCINGHRRQSAPGVYVDGRKLSALGLRIRHGCTYHGLSLNIDMDLTPFQGINPCGYAGLEVTQVRDLNTVDSFREVSAEFMTFLLSALHYQS